jgi:hypothetical protein
MVGKKLGLTRETRAGQSRAEWGRAGKPVGQAARPVGVWPTGESESEFGLLGCLPGRLRCKTFVGVFAKAGKVIAGEFGLTTRSGGEHNFLEKLLGR